MYRSYKSLQRDVWHGRGVLCYNWLVMLISIICTVVKIIVFENIEFWSIFKKIFQFRSLTFALFFRTFRKTIIPTARAERNRTVTTASPAIRAGWSDRESINVSFRLQKSLEQSICSVSGPEHFFPSFWGSGWLHFRARIWLHDALHTVHSCQFDQPPSILHDVEHSFSCLSFPTQSFPLWPCGGGESHDRFRKVDSKFQNNSLFGDRPLDQNNGPTQFEEFTYLWCIYFVRLGIQTRHPSYPKHHLCKRQV